MQVFWKPQPDSGNFCLGCMSQENSRGFVYLVSDVNIWNDFEARQVVGVAQAIYCAQCIEQAARMVGSATKDETMELAHSVMERDEIIEKREGELAMWQQRFIQLANLEVGDFEDLRRLEAERKNAPPPTGIA